MGVNRIVATSVAVSAAVLIASCSNTPATGPSRDGATQTSSAPSGMAGMPGMSEPMPTGDGLAAAQSGFTLVPATTTLTANTANPFTFRITGPGGAPVNRFVPELTKLLHLYAIRTDLTGFLHLHPTMSADGTWSITLPAMTPGDWRVYAQFTPNRPNDVTVPMVLSTPASVPGTATTAPLPPPSDTATVDGYTVTLAGQAAAGQAGQLTLDFSRDGQPVSDLQPYLDTYAHVTAIHAGTLAFAHLHPNNPVNGDHGGPTLSIESAFSAAGDWRLFIEFQTAATVHTAQTTIHVS
jgi:hypothetical protein